MRVTIIVSRATTAHPHSPKGHLPKTAIPRREFLDDGGLMPAAGSPGRVDETHRRVWLPNV